MENLTPSQAARRYADEKRFTIVTVGRRYDIMRNGGLIANVGGYPAALNAMKEHWQYLCDKQDDAPEPNDEERAHGDAETGALAIPADAIVGNVGAADSQCVESVVDVADTGEFPHKTRGEIIDDIKTGIEYLQQQSVADILNQRHVEEQLLHEIRTLPYDALMQLIQMVTGATLDKIARAKGWLPRLHAWSDQDFRVKLLNTATTFYCEPVVPPTERTAGVSAKDFYIETASGQMLDDLAKIPTMTEEQVRAKYKENKQLAIRHYNTEQSKDAQVSFDDFNEDSKRRIRKAAARMRAHKRPVTHILLWRYKGSRTYDFPCFSHADALKALRRMMSDKSNRPEWVTIQRIEGV